MEINEVFDEMLNAQEFNEIIYDDGTVKVSMCMIGCELHVRVKLGDRYVHISPGFCKDPENAIYGIDQLNDEMLVKYLEITIPKMWEIFKITRDIRVSVDKITI